jgi:hypothetical protein
MHYLVAAYAFLGQDHDQRVQVVDQQGQLQVYYFNAEILLDVGGVVELVDVVAEVGLEGVAQPRALQYLHQGGVAVHLATLADVDLVASLHQVREEVHQRDEVGQFRQYYHWPLSTAGQRPGLAGDSDGLQLLVLVAPLADQVEDGAAVGEAVELGSVETVVDVLLNGVLQFSEYAALVDGDVFVLVVDQCAQEVEDVGLVVIHDGGFVDQFGDVVGDGLHLRVAVEKLLVVGVHFEEEENGLTVPPLPQLVDKLVVFDAHAGVVDGGQEPQIVGLAFLVYLLDGLGLLLNVDLNLFYDFGHLQFGFLEVAHQQSQEAVDVLQHFLGVF